MTTEPFKVVNMMIGGPRHGQEIEATAGNRIIYAGIRPMRAVVLHPEETTECGYYEEVYVYDRTMHCEATSIMYRLFLYTGEKDL